MLSLINIYVCRNAEIDTGVENIFKVEKGRERERAMLSWWHFNKLHRCNTAMRITAFRDKYSAQAR